MKKLFNKLNSSIQKNSLIGLFNPTKKFAMFIPQKTVKIPKEIRKEIQKDPSKMKKYDYKFQLDPNDLDDYVIIGKEVLKNTYKEALVKRENKEITQAELEEMIKNDPNVANSMESLRYIEHGNSQQIFRRPFNYITGSETQPMFATPENDRIEPYNAIDMFKYSAPENDSQKLKENIYQKNKFITGFLPPFELSNQKLENISVLLKGFKNKYSIDLNSEENIHRIINDQYNKPLESVFIGDKTNIQYLKEYITIREELFEELGNINIGTIPNILMKFVFEIGFNDKVFWVILEQMILDNLHHYSIKELSKIFYVATFASPKFTTDLFRKIIYEEVYNQLENMEINDLQHVMLGFRESRNKKIYDKIANIIIDKKTLLCKNPLTDPANIIYSWALHKPKMYGVRTLIPHKELCSKLLNNFEDYYINNIMKMDSEHIARISMALSILKIEDVEIFTKRIERRTLKLLEKEKDKFGAFNLHAIIKSFSKMKYNSMCGSDKFFSDLEDIVIEFTNKNQFSYEEFSDIAYAYSIRGALSEKMKKFFNAYIEKNQKKFTTYHTMHNLFYYFMFTDYINVKVFETLVENYMKVESKLPLVYYRAFKLFDFYIANCSENEKLTPLSIKLRGKFYYAEQLYDYVKYERVYEESDEIKIFKDIITLRLIKDPITCLVKNNLMIVHFCFPEFKIGINVWSERHLVPNVNDKMRINEQHLLHSKLLKMKNWDILDLNWEEFVNMGDQLKKDEYIHNWFENAKISQHKKGICNILPKYV